MRVAIHQPHYFPWIGYFDKIAKVDTFVILDQVQFEKGSQMVRNRVLSNNGDIKYITISADTKDFLNRKYCDIQIKNPNEWKIKQKNALLNYYRKAEYRDEVMNIFCNFLSNTYLFLSEWTCESVKFVCRLLDIQTEIIYQSKIDYVDKGKKSDLVLSICQALKSDCYFSGRGGSVNYLDFLEFKKNGIDVVLQDFSHPIYKQCNSEKFIPGLSILDALLNCGIQKTKQMFWDNFSKTEFPI